MRRTLVQSLSSASRSVRSEISSPTTRTAPYICAECRRDASTRPRAIQSNTRRTFATAPSRRQQQPAPSSAPSEPQRETITPQTHYDFFPLTFPSGPPPNTPFTPDLKALRREFLSLQSKSHPDLAPPSRKRHAEALSSRINEAYVTLSDPLKRAQYLLSLQGIDVEDESAKLSGNGNTLLMEVMEAREAVEEVEGEEELVELRAENSARMERSAEELDKAFARGDLEAAATEAIRLRYWKNIEESIQGWEKGKGGGAIHH